jgi:hypothetical protein
LRDAVKLICDDSDLELGRGVGTNHRTSGSPAWEETELLAAIRWCPDHHRMDCRFHDATR